MMSTIISSNMKSVRKTRNTPEKIAIIGGYGNVGRVLSKMLAEELPGAVVIAGRNGPKADALAKEIANGATGLQIDVTQPGSYRELFKAAHNVRVIVSCIELPSDSTLPLEALQHGIHFTELSAEYGAHRRLIDADVAARKHGAAAVVGVGLIPGLSNVMAADLAAQLETVKDVHISIMLGLGEAHGADSIKWTLRQLGEQYAINYKSGATQATNFATPYKTTLLTERKPRTFYYFNFSDQHMLNQSLHAERVTSRMAFDSRLITRILAIAQSVGVLPVLKKVSPSLLYKIVSSSAIGSSRYALQVEVSGTEKGLPAKKTMLAQGTVEATATAAVAAYIARLLYEGKIASGTHAIEEVVNADQLYAYLKEEQILIVA